MPSRTSPTTKLVEWARSEMERRRSVWDNAMDDLMASEQQYLDTSWDTEPVADERREAS